MVDFSYYTFIEKKLKLKTILFTLSLFNIFKI